MSDVIVTERTVFDAADQIQRRGERVSVRSVRRELKGGSHETITPLLALWRASRSAPPPAPSESAPIPDAIDQYFNDAKIRCMEFARIEGKKLGDAASADCTAKIAVAVQERDSFALDWQEAEAELTAVQLELQSLRQSHAVAGTQVVELQREVEECNARARAAELREGETRKRADDLKAELEVSHQLHQVECEQSRQLRTDIAQLRSEHDETVKSMNAAIAAAATAEALAAEAKSQFRRLDTNAATDLDALAKECYAARHEARQQAEVIASLRGELSAVQRQASDFLALIKNGKSAADGGSARGAKPNAN